VYLSCLSDNRAATWQGGSLAGDEFIAKRTSNLIQVVPLKIESQNVLIIIRRNNQHGPNGASHHEKGHRDLWKLTILSSFQHSWLVSAVVSRCPCVPLAAQVSSLPLLAVTDLDGVFQYTMFERSRYLALSSHSHQRLVQLVSLHVCYVAALCQGVLAGKWQLLGLW